MSGNTLGPSPLTLAHKRKRRVSENMQTCKGWLVTETNVAHPPTSECCIVLRYQKGSILFLSWSLEQSKSQGDKSDHIQRSVSIYIFKRPLVMTHILKAKAQELLVRLSRQAYVHAYSSDLNQAETPSSFQNPGSF